MFGTTLFFQIVHLSEIKDWPLAGLTALIPLFTGAGLVALFAAGLAIDRLGVRRTVPLMLLPAAAGYVLFGLGGTLPAAALGFLLVGLTQGMVGAVAGTYWPEIYGTRHLGSIRALATSVMVFATALGPGLSGLLLDLRVGLEVQLLAMAALCIAACAGLALAAAAAHAPAPAEG